MEETFMAKRYTLRELEGYYTYEDIWSWELVDLQAAELVLGTFLTVINRWDKLQLVSLPKSAPSC